MILIHNVKVNNISQKIYDSMIEKLDYSLLYCPHCQHTGMKVHAYYDRGIKADDTYFRMTVLRVKCSFCGRTHAILPDCIVPYSQVLLHDVIDIIQAGSAGDFNRILTQNLCLDFSDIYRIRNNYRKFWKERLASFGIKLNGNISVNCIRQFRRQFMQIRCTLCGDYG